MNLKQKQFDQQCSRKNREKKSNSLTAFTDHPAFMSMHPAAKYALKRDVAESSPAMAIGKRPIQYACTLANLMILLYHAFVLKDRFLVLSQKLNGKIISHLQGKAFCQEHCTLLSQNGYPVGLKDFIKYCGCDPSKYNR